jgi:hypothetical protein
MKRNTLITSIGLILVGFITTRIGDSLSTVTESGMVQDSFLMPIGAILLILGILVLIVSVVWYLVDILRGRLKKD